MMAKVGDLYAERTSWGAAAARTALGFFLLLGFYFVTGFLIYGRVLAIGGMLYFAVLGPFLILPLIQLWLRASGRVRLLDLRAPAQADLVQSYFESILRRPGPEPIFYVYRSNDLAIFWFQCLNPFSKNQKVFLPEGWFAEPAKERIRDLEGLWDQMATHGLGKRRLRSLQFVLWCSGLLPLELLFRIFQKIFDASGFRDQPTIAFWCLRAFASFRGFFFGGGHRGDPLNGLGRSTRVRAIRAWTSPCLGVWTLSPPRYLHPLWSILAHSDSLLVPRG